MIFERLDIFLITNHPVDKFINFGTIGSVHIGKEIAMVDVFTSNRPRFTPISAEIL
jgi:hypothetical protein